MAGGVGIMSMDYLGGFQYQGTALKFFPTAEGYVRASEGKSGYAYSYVYNYNDHLGNIRLSYAKDPENPNVLKILEENHYYPFGLKHTNYNSDLLVHRADQGSLKIMDPNTPVPLVLVLPYNYKFQGQERQDELGLNVDSYKWRNYDYAIGRFLTMDRFSEKYTPISPYSRVANNPLKYAEIEGDSIMLIIGKPYKDYKGKEHPYGHVALRVYNSKHGYDYVYDFGRYGNVHWNQTTGDGILNIYDDSAAYFKTEQSIRESIGYAEYSSVAEDKEIISYFNSLAKNGTKNKKGDGKNKTSYKLSEDYDIFDNNCCTMSTDGLSLIEENWLGEEHDPRNALSFLEKNYKKLGLSRTVYKKGGITITTYVPPPPKKKEEKKKEKKEEKKKEEKKKKS